MNSSQGNLLGNKQSHSLSVIRKPNFGRILTESPKSSQIPLGPLGGFNPFRSFFKDNNKKTICQIKSPFKSRNRILDSFSAKEDEQNEIPKKVSVRRKAIGVKSFPIKNNLNNAFTASQKIKKPVLPSNPVVMNCSSYQQTIVNDLSYLRLGKAA